MISVIINTLRRPLELEKALNALEKQTYKDFEVIVVFGPDDEVSRQMVSVKFPTAKQARVEVANLSISRNEGIKNAASEWIAFLDDDGIPEIDWLEELYTFAEATGIDIVSGPLVDRTGLEYQALSVTSNIHGESFVFKRSKQELPFLTKVNSLSSNYPSVVGANFMIRRSTLEAIGGYDEVFEYYLDETDLCIRAVHVGAKIGYAPYGAVHHKWRAGVVRGENRVTSNYWPILKNFAYFNLKHASLAYSKLELEARYLNFANKCKQDLTWAIAHNLLDIEFLASFELHKQTAWNHALNQFKEHAFSPGVSKIEKLSDFKKFRTIATRSIVITCKDASPGKSSGIGNLMKSRISSLSKESYSIKVIYFDTNIFLETGEAITYSDGIWWINAAALPKSYREAHERNVNQFKVDNHAALEHVGDFASRICIWLSWIKEHTKISGVFTQSWDAEGYFLAKQKIPFAVFAYTPARVVQALCSNLELKNVLGQLWELEKLCLEGSELVIFDSNFLLEDLSDLDISNKAVSYPGIKVNEINPFYQIGDFYLYVGNLDPRKGFDWLIETWQLALTLQYKINLVIVGVSTEELINYLAEKNIRIENLPTCLGRIKDEELSRLYSSCTAVVIPSKYESFGLPSIEGMSHGKPFIGANNSALSEIAEISSAGILVEEGDTESLLKALSEIPPDYFRKIGISGLNACLDIFSIENTANELIGIINRFLGKEEINYSLDLNRFGPLY